MEESLNTLKVEASGAVMTFGFKLSDMYCNFGGQVQMTMTKNAGEENESVIQIGQTSSQLSINGEFDTQEKFDQFIQDNPSLGELIIKILQKASEPYAG